MPEKYNHSSDLRGLGRLAVEAIIGLTNMLEDAHMRLLKGTMDFATPVHQPVSAVTASVYHQIRQITRLAGSGVDVLLNWLTPVLLNNEGWKGREPVIAVLNGVLGDHLQASDNPLAIEMALRYRGQPVPLNSAELRRLIPELNGRILVLAHGLCMSDRLWDRNQHDHGTALERDCRLTPVYLRYNSGLHISTNGHQLAEQLETLILNWPVPVQEIAFLGHSMGGMLIRSAFHYASAARLKWPGRVSTIIFLGTPHHGAPLERGGHWFHMLLKNSAFLTPFANLGRVRSSGITDLRYGNLLDQDWEGVDRFGHSTDVRSHLALPRTVNCCALAATVGRRANDVRDRLLGDGLVPVNSALGVHQNPQFSLRFRPENQAVLCGMNHLDLLSRREVYEQIRQWLSEKK